MDSPEWRVVPSAKAGDAVHGLIKGTLSALGGPAGDLFALLIRAPFQRRLEEWIERVEMRLRHLAERDRQIIQQLPTNEDFASVLISATQAAARTHQEAKLEMLAAAVENSAEGINIEADFQLAFVRFVDELTPTHFALLRAIVSYPDAVAEVASYTALRMFFAGQVDGRITDSHFKLLCNDLEVRVLARFSETLEDFGGIATRDAIVLESLGVGARVVATEIGKLLLRFVTSASGRRAT